MSVFCICRYMCCFVNSKSGSGISNLNTAGSISIIKNTFYVFIFISGVIDISKSYITLRCTVRICATGMCINNSFSTVYFDIPISGRLLNFCCVSSCMSRIGMSFCSIPIRNESTCNTIDNSFIIVCMLFAICVFILCMVFFCKQSIYAVCCLWYYVSRNSNP